MAGHTGAKSGIIAGRKSNLWFPTEKNHIIFVFYLTQAEIQEAPKALASLKYFYENAPQYAIMAAGSLLGVAMHQGTSFPVGKVDFMHLYPLDFFEFVCALGEKELARLLESGNFEMINAYSTRYTELLKMYYYIGGMPEVVQTFLDTDDFYEVREVQRNLLEYYEEDFSKHAPREVIPRIMMVWNSIPSQLAKENRKFLYGIIREGARAKDFELAIQWLEDAGLDGKCALIRFNPVFGTTGNTSWLIFSQKELIKTGSLYKKCANLPFFLA